MCGGGGGGDGGAADRQAAEEARIAEAIRQINEAIGQENAKAAEVDRAKYQTEGYWTGGDSDGGGQTWVEGYFDQAGYDAAIAAAEASAKASRDKFGERAKSYDVLKTDATNHARVDLDKERALTERDANFMLARQGVSGGSRDIDVNRDILDTFNQGIVKASSMGSAVATNARAADDATRMNLITSVRNGLDAGNAVGNSYTEMSNNSARARDDAANQSLTGFFDVLARRFKQNAYDNGVNSNAPAQSPSTPSRTNSSAGSQGTITSYG